MRPLHRAAIDVVVGVVVVGRAADVADAGRASVILIDTAIARCGATQNRWVGQQDAHLGQPVGIATPKSVDNRRHLGPGLDRLAQLADQIESPKLPKDSQGDFEYEWRAASEPG